MHEASVASLPTFAEGAKVRGFRAVAIDLLPDTPDLPDVEAGNGVIVFGRNGVEDSVLNSGEQELGIVITVTGGGLERNRSHLALLRATLLHWGFDGRKATAGNLAFPFSPSDLQFGDEGVLTLCGTRDPSFISRWPQILKEVEEYVRSLSSHEDLTVRFVAAGLDGLGFLKCREVVASTAEAASAGLQVDARAIQTWQCHGSVAAARCQALGLSCFGFFGCARLHLLAALRITQFTISSSWMTCCCHSAAHSNNIEAAMP